MNKSLTEKWKDGELPEGTYYVMFLCGRYGTYEFEKLKGFGFDNDLAYIKEVLAPVPSYEEYKELLDLNVYDKLQKENKKLATKCHQLVTKCNRLEEEVKREVASNEELLEVQKRLEERLADADKTIHNIAILMACDPKDMTDIDDVFCPEQMVLDYCNEYQNKWGVK